jgi:hypothetical protein
MTKPAAHEVLRRLFDVVIDEAKHNDLFARQLVEALCDVAEIEPDKHPVARRSYDSAGFHAVNVLRSHGEAALRGRLEQIRASGQLRSIASASGLLLSGGASRPKASRNELIEGILAAAKHYDAQRSEAVMTGAAVPPSPQGH